MIKFNWMTDKPNPVKALAIGFLILDTASASETLDCHSKSFHVSISIGYENHFSDVRVYNKKSTQRSTFKKGIFYDVEMNWDEKSLCFLSGSQNKLGQFNMCTKDKSGMVISSGIQEKITCDWIR